MKQFHPLVREWFYSHYPSPTDVQQHAWDALSAGKNIFVTAPTGSGKTLTAFLWAVNTLVTAKTHGARPSVLYISPLKALNNDIYTNLLEPIDEICTLFQESSLSTPSVTVAVRSGDTDQNERRRMYKRPPDILITTPESINIMLASVRGRSILTGITTVILDEIHYLAPGKRGTHLMSAVERLTLLSGEFQRIALSATVRPVELVADFVGGYRHVQSGGYEKRSMLHISSREEKKYDVSVRWAEESETAAGITADYLALLAREIVSIIEQYRSTIIFANSRRMVEKLCRYINEKCDTEAAYAHHGSLSREIRAEVERRLKHGELQAIVATSSLELGIDVGDVECVLLIQSPREVSHALQRIGRSNHAVGMQSRGIIYPTHGVDTVFAASIARLVREKNIEPLRIPENPLDVLAQLILSMTLVEQWHIDALYHCIRCIYSFHSLTRKIFDLVVEMLDGRYAGARIGELTPKIEFNRITGLIHAREGVRYRLFSSGGMIPDRGQYTLRLAESGQKIGELDEEFVWERNIGDTFAFGVQNWRIVSVTDNDVRVHPATSRPGIIPFWRAEAQNRSFYVSEYTGCFLQQLNVLLDKEEPVQQLLQEEYLLEVDAAGKLSEFLQRQRAHTASPLPHRYHLLVEEFSDAENASDNRQIILHTLWGGQVNRPLGFALAGYWQQEFGYSLEIFTDNDCILLHLPHETDILDVLRAIGSHNVRNLLHAFLEQSGYFGALFRENAARSLLLPPKGFKNRQPLWLNRLRARKLFEAVSGYEDFPVMLETWRQAFADEFDIPSLCMLLDEIDDGTICIGRCRTTSPSPFSSGIIWNRTNKYMYEDDTPRGGTGTKTNRSLIEEIARTTDSISLPGDVVQLLDARLKRTAPGYAGFTGADELCEWISERLFLPETEYRTLLNAYERDTESIPDDLAEQMACRCVCFCCNGVRCITTCEMYARLAAVSLAPHDGYEPLAPDYASSIESRIEKYMAVVPEDADCELLWTQFLSYYAVLAEDEAQRLFPGLFSDGTIPRAVESGALIRNDCIVDDNRFFLILPDNYERLLRMLRRYRQQHVALRPVEHLLPFMMAHSGATVSDTGKELQDVLDDCIGYYAPVHLWEEEILPARIPSYQPMALDSLLSSTPLILCGADKKKSAFFFEHEEQEPGINTCAVHVSEESFRRYYHGRPFTVEEVVRDRGVSTAAATDTVWQAFFSGILYTRSFHALRNGVKTGFTAHAVSGTSGKRPRRSGYSRWKSSRPLTTIWYARRAVDTETETTEFDQLEQCKETVRQLFLRYGILFRQLCEYEMPGISWRMLFKALRIMELSGEIYCGCFFDGVDSLQFISQDAFARFRDFQPETVSGWLCAADPLSLSGCRIPYYKEKLPHRKEGNHFVLHRGEVHLVCTSLYKRLCFYCAPEAVTGELLAPLHNALNRVVNPLSRIRVEQINGEAPEHSPYTAPLCSLGFRRDGTTLLLEKTYGATTLQY